MKLPGPFVSQRFDQNDATESETVLFERFLDFGAVDFGKRRVFVHGTFRERVELVVFDPDGEVLGGILELDFRAPFVATYVVGFEHDGFDAGYPYEHTEHDRSFIVGFANFIFAETFDTGDVGPETVDGVLLNLDGDAEFLRLHM